MAEVIHFVKYDNRVKGMVPKDPPADYASVLLKSRGMWSFPPLRAVIEAPTLRADGSILQAPGYDQDTGLYYAPSAEFGPIPENPTRDDAMEALERLREPLKDFPFVGRQKDDQKILKSESVALAAILTALVRRSLRIAPMFLFDAPTPASGKTLLANVVAHIATGHGTAEMTYTGDPDEERKQIMTMLMSGDAVVLYDNIDKPLEGAALCSVLTSDVYKSRMLGKNSAEAKLQAPTCSTFMGNGNNILVRGDMRTRVLLCRIDPNMEKPEERNLDAGVLMRFVDENRASLVQDGLIALRAYFVAGSPKQDIKPCRFPEWSNIVRSALVWLGCDDPVDTMRDVAGDDPGAAMFHAVVAELDKLLSDGGMTSGQIKEKADDKVTGNYDGASPYVRPKLRQVLIDAVGDRGEISAQKLAWYLKGLDGCVFGKLKFVGQDDAHAGQKVWKTITVA